MSELYAVAHGFSLQKKRVRVYRRLFTRANAWTASGILCVVLYALFYTSDSYTSLIPLLVAYTVVTDVLDGRSAEKWDAHTRLGAILDPIRDRLLGAVLLSNVLFLSDGEVLSLLALFAAAICVAELCIAIGNSFWGEGVHLVGKIRFGVHSMLGFQFVLQTYYPWHIHVPDTFLLFGMALVSIGALCCYAWTWLSHEK